MVKVFQIFNGVLYRFYPEYKSIADTVGKYAPNIEFVEAPDYVFESWGYDPAKKGDKRFIKPEPPEGFVYDENNGTFYPEELIGQRQRMLYEQEVQQLIRQKYTATDEFKVLRKALANPNDEETQAQFAEYNDYVEQCKNEAQTKVYSE